LVAFIFLSPLGYSHTSVSTTWVAVDVIRLLIFWAIKRRHAIAPISDTLSQHDQPLLRLILFLVVRPAPIAIIGIIFNLHLLLSSLPFGFWFFFLCYLIVNTIIALFAKLVKP